MKFRNSETGDIFDDIIEARVSFCEKNICWNCKIPNSSKDDSLPPGVKNCREFCLKFPHEAAALMGYEVIDEKEANMNKPLKDWTLGEVKAYCTGRDCYKDCELAQSPGKCKILDVTPSEWDLDEKPRFTEQEVERAKAIKVIWPEAKEVRSRNGAQGEIEYRVCTGFAVLGVLYGDVFPTMERLKEYTLDEIIGGAE